MYSLKTLFAVTLLIAIFFAFVYPFLFSSLTINSRHELIVQRHLAGEPIAFEGLHEHHGERFDTYWYETPEVASRVQRQLQDVSVDDFLIQKDWTRDGYSVSKIYWSDMLRVRLSIQVIDSPVSTNRRVQYIWLSREGAVGGNASL